MAYHDDKKPSINAKSTNSAGDKISKQGHAQRISSAALLATLALIFSYIEAIIPMPVGIPGVKLGIANLVIIVALYSLGMRYALPINLIRIIVAGLLFSGLFGAIYSLSGGMLSLIVMAILKKTDFFSIIGVSIAGAVSHNFGQIVVAALIIQNVKIFTYMPILVFSGIISGMIIGILAHYIRRTIDAIQKIR